MIIVAVAYTVPLFITIVQTLVSGAIVAFLVIMKPFEKKVNQIQLLIFESVILVMNFFLMILSGIDTNDSYIEDFAIFVGDLVIIGNDIINILSLVFLVVKIGLESIAINKSIKKYSIPTLMQIPCYLQLIGLYVQLSNMGFEEMISYDFSNVNLNQVTPLQVKPTSLSDAKGDTTFQKLGVSDVSPDTTSRINITNNDKSGLMPDSKTFRDQLEGFS